jgi:integrase
VLGISATFLAFTKDDPLGPLFRIVLLRGARRGEAVGLRWSDSDLDSGYVRVRRPIVLVRGAVTESTPKTKTGDRPIWLDVETVRIPPVPAARDAGRPAGDQAARGTPLSRQPGA